LANGYGMDAPLPLPQVQKVAGHKDIGTTMRYVHTDGIKNTGSRQWSRDQRKAVKAGLEVPESQQEASAAPVVASNSEPTRIESPRSRYGHLRVVNSSDS